jgi:hypothetical protein
MQAKGNIKSYIERTGLTLGVPKDKVFEKLQEVVDSNSHIAQIAKQYSDYAT